MSGWDCKPALRHPQTVRIPFAANRNLLVFWANTKRTGCASMHWVSFVRLRFMENELTVCCLRTTHERRARVYKASNKRGILGPWKAQSRWYRPSQHIYKWPKTTRKALCQYSRPWVPQNQKSLSESTGKFPTYILGGIDSAKGFF